MKAVYKRMTRRNHQENKEEDVQDSSWHAWYLTNMSQISTAIDINTQVPFLISFFLKESNLIAYGIRKSEPQTPELWKELKYWCWGTDTVVASANKVTWSLSA